jgi:hypothetical protein|tara:strand:- start:914 stop:1048 length:135 start_codon:yes stop_codon:yes gene_type:complete
MNNYFKAIEYLSANDKREQERQLQERLKQWERLRKDYPAIERNT